MFESLSKLPTIMTTLMMVVISPALAQTADTGRTISETIKTLDRGTVWKRVGQIPLSFPTFHPQGMVKIGDFFYITSVEITTPTKKYDKPQDGYDRDTGKGVGHLFKVDSRAISLRTSSSAKARSIIRAVLTSTAMRFSCRLPNTGRTAHPSSIKSILRQ